MRRMSRGFTIIELLVVVSVIGILATISLIGFNRYQADTRDSQRSSQATILAEALEKYYDKHGEYPSCTSITSDANTVTTAILPGLQTDTLVTPQDPNVEDNSIKCQDLTTSDPDIFAYVGDGSSICSTGNACLSYTLKYKEESTGTIKTLPSRRQTSICTSADISDLAATTFSFQQVNLAWTAVGGATSYNIRYSTNQTMTGATSFTPSTTNSAQVTGLTLGTLYYFQVQPSTGSTSCNWSNTPSATTYTLDTPDGSAIPDPAAPASQLKLTWAAVTNATSYTVDYNSTGSVDGSGRLASPTTLTSVTTPAATSPLVITGLTAGTTKYFKIKANAASYTSGWSAVDSATTTVPVPTGLVATTNSSTQITANWSTVSVATSYSLEYSTDSTFTSPAPTTTLTSTAGRINSIAGLSQAVTGLQQGQIFYFRVYALVGAVSSLASSSANATTTIDTPSAPSIAAYQPGAVRAYAAGWWVAFTGSPASGNWYYAYSNTGGSCPAGSYPVYQISARYNSPATTYYTGATTGTQWFMIRPTSGNYIKFGAQQYCQGVSTASAWTGWNYSCATNPGTGPVGCPF